MPSQAEACRGRLPVGWLVGCLVGPPGGWLVNWLVGWSLGWTDSRLDGQLVSWLVALKDNGFPELKSNDENGCISIPIALHSFNNTHSV